MEEKDYIQNNCGCGEGCTCDECESQKYGSVHELVRKEGKGKVPVYPLTYIQAVFDRKTGVGLETILAQFNNVFLQYQGTPYDTRNFLPVEMRRKGIIISYKDMKGGIITERCVNDTWKDNAHWGLDSNWVRIDELSLSGDISVSVNGTWVINGKDTGINAVGPQGNPGEAITPRVNLTNDTVEYSWNNRDWYEMFKLSVIRPTLDIDQTVTKLQPGATPTVQNEGDGFNMKLKFGLPASPTVQVGSVNTLEEWQQATVVNGGTAYEAVLNFSIPRGHVGSKGDKGDGWQVKGFVGSEDLLPTSGNTLGDTYIVGTTTPYSVYMYDGSDWINVGTATEIKAGVFDGGRADSKYGGARTIDCGRADLSL